MRDRSQRLSFAARHASAQRHVPLDARGHGPATDGAEVETEDAIVNGVRIGGLNEMREWQTRANGKGVTV